MLQPSLPPASHALAATAWRPLIHIMEARAVSLLVSHDTTGDTKRSWGLHTCTERYDSGKKKKKTGDESAQCNYGSRVKSLAISYSCLCTHS